MRSTFVLDIQIYIWSVLKANLHSLHVWNKETRSKPLHVRFGREFLLFSININCSFSLYLLIFFFSFLIYIPVLLLILLLPPLLLPSLHFISFFISIVIIIIVSIIWIDLSLFNYCSFIIIIYIITFVIIVITAAVLDTIFIVTKISAGAVQCFYEVSCAFVFDSLSFLFRDHRLVLMHYVSIIIWHHLIMVAWKKGM